ncbi:TetR/AcrR family transcriptional regulator [Streptomyces sp. NPDC005438]|uniref:TetR/AcrR family transcriptional regulator n=1 Tax=Streptomyces sp. NPDC005438 TaxID=3156880 RepID=UPI0033A0CAF6
MPEPPTSPRKAELLDAAYQYALTHGLTGLSLRPLAQAVGSSPRVLLFLFGSKDGLVRALLTRARAEELDLLDAVRREEPADLCATARRLWQWLAAAEHRGLLTLWVEAYATSLVAPEGPWADFARETVTDWLDLLAAHQPATVRGTPAGAAERSRVLALLRGALLDLLATGDRERTTAAVHRGLPVGGDGHG